MAARENLLVVNAGSSSIKLAVFDAALRPVLTADASGISDKSGTGTLRFGSDQAAAKLPDHATALNHLMAGLSQKGVSPETLSAAGHRIVHGGANLVSPVQITDATLAEIMACSDLAPLHNPHSLNAIHALSKHTPDLPQVACFDTAFHATNPELATRYAVPEDWRRAGIRRYGFHGISYQALIRRLPEISGAPVPPRLLACHLGNGASICAIKDGESVASTMGYSPLEGLTMGTRSGSIDAAAVLRRVEDTGLEQTRSDLLFQSGLLGLSGISADMRDLEESSSPDAQFALEHFSYWAARHAGSMIAAMGGVDAIAFTGGIGENAEGIRQSILDRLAWANVPDEAVFVVPADEERQIAMLTLQTLNPT